MRGILHDLGLSFSLNFTTFLYLSFLEVEIAADNKKKKMIEIWKITLKNMTVFPIHEYPIAGKMSVARVRGGTVHT